MPNASCYNAFARNCRLDLSLNFTPLMLASPLPLHTLVAQWVIFGVKVAALCVLGYFAVKSFQELRTSLDQKSISLETYWGGLGGNLGGWSVSKSLVWFILTFACVLLFALVTLHVGDQFLVSPPEEQAQSAGKKPDPEASGTGAKTPASAKTGETQTQPAEQKQESKPEEKKPEEKKPDEKKLGEKKQGQS